MSACISVYIYFLSIQSCIHPSSCFSFFP
jgi:hypothetical protein